MPVLGRGAMLAQAVYSILAQGYKDVELVIQDGDPDNPVSDDCDACVALAVMNGHLNYKVGRDRGIYDAGNMCFRRATGDILYFMGSDDLLCPGSLAAVNAAFKTERFGGPFWLYGRTVSADAMGRTQGVDGVPTTYDEMLVHNRLGSPAVFWNRRMMDLAGMFDLRYRWASEYELWLRFWRRCEPLFLAQELGVFRHHGNNASQLHVDEVEAECAKISARHAALDGIITRARNRFASAQEYSVNPSAEKE